MLPDFLTFKERQARTLARAIAAGEGIVAEIQRLPIYEGDAFITGRADGSRSQQTLIQLSESVNISTETIQSGNLQALKDALTKLRQSVSAQQTKVLLEAVSEAADSIGNVTSAGGKPITAELILDALGKIELSFHPDGRWDPPTMVLHPVMEERARREWERLTTEPGLRSQLEALIQAGRQKWRDREGNRKLVD